jgi:hypothetical protein
MKRVKLYHFFHWWPTEHRAYSFYDWCCNRRTARCDVVQREAFPLAVLIASPQKESANQ